jgi:hypothetical protein
MVVPSKHEVRRRQELLNAFTSKYLRGVGPLPVDGVEGPLTKKRIVHCKWWLGWQKRGAAWSDRLEHYLRHPTCPGQMTRATRVVVERGRERRRDHNRDHWRSYLHPGVTTYDGVRVARCAVPILNWCRANGWHGHLVSGWRSPAYSTSLCYAKCGRPQCPGTCAGAASNHSGDSPERFAVDVSDFYTFANVVRACPLKPHIFNDLPADRVHFSPSGR